jgi:hypothetical protein
MRSPSVEDGDIYHSLAWAIHPLTVSMSDVCILGRRSICIKDEVKQFVMLFSKWKIHRKNQNKQNFGSCPAQMSKIIDSASRFRKVQI